jgi:hypothetical protein
LLTPNEVLTAAASGTWQAWHIQLARVLRLHALKSFFLTRSTKPSSGDVSYFLQEHGQNLLHTTCWRYKLRVLTCGSYLRWRPPRHRRRSWSPNAIAATLILHTGVYNGAPKGFLMRTFPTAVASSLFPLFFFLLPFYTSLYHMFEQIEMNREGDLRERIGDEVAVLLRRQVAEEDGRAQAETYRDVITFHFIFQACRTYLTAWNVHALRQSPRLTCKKSRSAGTRHGILPRPDGGGQGHPLQPAARSIPLPLSVQGTSINRCWAHGLSRQTRLGVQHDNYTGLLGESDLHGWTSPESVRTEQSIEMNCSGPSSPRTWEKRTPPRRWQWQRDPMIRDPVQRNKALALFLSLVRMKRDNRSCLLRLLLCFYSHTCACRKYDVWRTSCSTFLAIGPVSMGTTSIHPPYYLKRAEEYSSGWVLRVDIWRCLLRKWIILVFIYYLVHISIDWSGRDVMMRASPAEGNLLVITSSPSPLFFEQSSPRAVSPVLLVRWWQKSATTLHGSQTILLRHASGR